jgi:NAD(P)-dependent dehydrogenase (short-subunit alcohol dehydrogenase family)
MNADVLVVTGTGGMGEAIARRMGAGRTVVLADAYEAQLARVTDALVGVGYVVRAVATDISSAAEVQALAERAASFGTVRCVAHTAGVSPVDSTTKRIVAVDVVGTAHVLDAFEPHVQPGTVAVCIASMAGALYPVDDETRRLFATTPTAELASLPVFADVIPGLAYAIAKRANQVRVEAASIPWGRRGGRVVSISPGVIATPMGRAELAGESGDFMRTFVEGSGTQRLGTPDDIAAAVEFLASPAASFITGTDLLVDGGAVAGLRLG